MGFGDVLDVLGDILNEIIAIPGLIITMVKFPVELLLKLVDLIKELPKLFGDLIKIGVVTADIINYMVLILPALIVLYFIAEMIIDFEDSYR
jgi:hypothetical protein